MRFLLTPFGSSGDVHPFVGLARELRSRGHEAILFTAEPHRAVVERAGITFASVCTTEAYHSAIADPDLWHPRRGLQTVLRMAAESLEPTWQALDAHYQPSNTMLVGHPASFATRAFEEKSGCPAATIHLAPGSIRSAYQVPALPPGVDISRAPLWFKRVLWSLVDRSIDSLIIPELNRWRSAKGLPSIRRIFKDWINSPRATVGLFPEWFGARQPDWPAQFHHAGFPLWDDPDGPPPAQGLERFLAAGPAPVVFSPGSANRQASAFFAAAAEALQRIGRRGLFLTGFPEQLPQALPDTILHCSYVPFSAVLPRATAFVHHGGIGSLAQGFAAGIPQLLMPMAFDQPDNALRAGRLGVARWLTPGRFAAARVARALEHLLNNRPVARATAECRDRLRGVDGLALAADHLERLARA